MSYQIAFNKSVLKDFNTPDRLPKIVEHVIADEKKDAVSEKRVPDYYTALVHSCDEGCLAYAQAKAFAILDRADAFYTR